MLLVENLIKNFEQRFASMVAKTNQNTNLNLILDQMHALLASRP